MADKWDAGYPTAGNSPPRREAPIGVDDVGPSAYRFEDGGHLPDSFMEFPPPLDRVAVLHPWHVVELPAEPFVLGYQRPVVGEEQIDLMAPASQVPGDLQVVQLDPSRWVGRMHVYDNSQLNNNSTSVDAASEACSRTSYAVQRTVPKTFPFVLQ